LDLRKSIVAGHQSRKGYKAILKSIILQWGRLFTSGKYSRQLPIFPGVDIPAIHPKVRQCTTNWKNPKKP